MNQRNLQNENLDRIARRLLDAARVSDENIEKIVAAPNLFDSIKNRIESEKSELHKNQFSIKLFANPLFLKWQTTAVFALLLISIAAFVINSKTGNSSVTLSEQTFAPTKQNEEIQSNETQRIIPNDILKNPPLAVKINEPASEIRQNRVNLKNLQNLVKTRKLTARKTPPKLKTIPNQIDSAGKFYALNYAGISADPNSEVKIVRAELSRSALFALGVNLPLENETEKIKTDLLVGDDGVARAIRFVN